MLSRRVHVDDAPAGGAIFRTIGRDGETATRQLTGYLGKLLIRPVGYVVQPAAGALQELPKTALPRAWA